MSDTMGRILIFLGGLIATLLIVLLILLMTSDDGSPIAAGVATTTTVVATTSPTSEATTTTLPATTTTAASSTTTTTAPNYLWPEGYGTITAGADHDALIAAGDLVFVGWDATGPSDGYWCGWADGAGDYAGRVGVQLFESVGVINVLDPTITTSDGLGIGSSEADIIAALGPPTWAGPGHYVPTEWEMYYEFGAYGYHFHFETRGTPAQVVKAGFYDNIQLVEGCL
jgi:hypothetical protein